MSAFHTITSLPASAGWKIQTRAFFSFSDPGPRVVGNFVGAGIFGMTQYTHLVNNIAVTEAKTN